MPTLATEAWLVILIGLFIGSFLGVLIVRLPAGETVVRGRSRCPHCGRTLTARDLLPIVSWLLARGACRHCGARLGVFYPTTELAGAAVALWAATATSGWILVATCVLGWLLLALAVIDQRHMILPDALTMPLAALGIVVAVLLPAADPLDHVLGAVGGFAAFWLVALAYRATRGREGLGAGDAKLLAAAGAWVSWSGLPGVVLLGAVLALVTVLALRVAGRRQATAKPIPFGPYLCLATWCTWLYGPITFGP